MIRLISRWIFLFAALNSFQSMGQNFLIHLNQSKYISGDEIYYNVYPQHAIATDSSIIFVELYSPNSVLVMQQIHALSGASILGVFSLPYNVSEGTYTFISYSVFDDKTRDSSIILSSFTYVPIYNEVNEAPDIIKANEWKSFPSNAIKSENKIIATFKPKIKKQIELSINDQIKSGSNGVYSVTINKFYEEENKEPLRNNQEIILSKNFISRKKLTLEGIITNPENHQLVNEKYLSLYFPSNGSFQRIDAFNGQLKVELPSYTGIKKFQILSLNPNQRSPLEWKPKSYSDKFKSIILGAPAIRRSDEDHFMLMQHTKKRLVDDLFQTDHTKTEAIDDTIKSYDSDKTYKISDFQDIKSLEEFIKEVLVDCNITSAINDIKSLRLRNKDSRDLYRWPAWYLLDGYFRGDEDIILNYDISKIKTIDLFQRKKTIESQFDQMMAYSGIFSITTYLQDQLPEQVYHVNGFYPPNAASSHSDLMNPEIPNLDTNPLWISGSKADQQGFLHIPFNSGDLVGKYQIEVKGINNKNQFSNATYYLEIKN